MKRRRVWEIPDSAPLSAQHLDGYDSLAVRSAAITQLCREFITHQLLATYVHVASHAAHLWDVVGAGSDGLVDQLLALDPDTKQLLPDGQGHTTAHAQGIVTHLEAELTHS